jgi:hypothetical protein
VRGLGGVLSPRMAFEGAERGGFEPPIPLIAEYLISSQARSTTPAPLLCKITTLLVSEAFMERPLVVLWKAQGRLGIFL